MKAGFIIIILFLSSFKQTFTQGVEYARPIINELCSEKFHGRGYGFGGDRLAAQFIVNEMKKHGCKAFDKSYLQPFKLNSNILNGNTYIKMGTVDMDPGFDYIVSPASNSTSGSYQIVKLTPSVINDSAKFRNFVKRDFSNKALLIDTLGLNRRDFKSRYDLITEKNVLKAKIIIKICENSLIYLPSEEKKNFVQISILRDALPGFFQKITLDITSKLLENYKTNNVIGYLKGKSDTSIVISAHYDHIGRMGLNTYFPGANDNSSGVAMALYLAKKLSKEKKLKYNIVFIFFSGEELGLLGSKYYTEHPVFPMSNIKFLINLDMVGSGDKGIQVVNGSVFKKEFDKLYSLNAEKSYLLDVKTRGAAANSDHYFFYEKGIKSFFIYTLGEYMEYHNIYDKPDRLPLTEFNDLSDLLIDFIKTF